LAGDDEVEECIGPIFSLAAFYSLFLSPLVIIPIISAYSAQVYSETMYRGQSAKPKYLVALTQPRRPPAPPAAQPTASDMGMLAAEVGETGSDISSAFAAAGADEASPLLSGDGRAKPSPRLGVIPEGSTRVGKDRRGESVGDGVGEGYAVAKIASSKDKRRQYAEATAAVLYKT